MLLLGTPDMTYWYRYINTCMLLNSWDSTKEALNGADCDKTLSPYTAMYM